MSTVSKNGDQIIFTITADNSGPNVETNAAVAMTIPTGVIFKSYSAEKGTYNTLTDTFEIGIIEVGKSYDLVWYGTVTDIAQAVETPPASSIFGFTVDATVSGDNVDPNAGNNVKSIFVELTPCVPAAGAVDDVDACLCGNVGDNDTPCSHGTTEYRLNAGSLTNIDAGFDINTDGSYNLNGQITDPTAIASFTYSIWCVVVPITEEYEIGSPATVSIPAMLLTSDSVVDNADGTITHTGIDGVQVTWNAGWTTVVGDLPSQTLTFTYPDGTIVAVDMSAWFVVYPELTVSTTTITTNTVLTNITLKHFHKVDDSGAASIAITLPDPSTLGLAADATMEWTFKRIVTDSAGTITIDATAGNIDTAVSFNLPGVDYASVTVWTDGTDWWIK